MEALAPVFTLTNAASGHLSGVMQKLRQVMLDHGYREDPEAEAPRVVLNPILAAAPRPYRRKSQGTLVISFLELEALPANPIQALYPYIVRALSNQLVVYVPGEGAHFLTLELGYYHEPEGPHFAQRIFERIEPIASSVLVINNRFDPDLEATLWSGDAQTAALSQAGARLAEWDLLPAPFPIEEILGPEDFRHVKRLYGIGGLSYGNLSVRKDATRFWMSASGVDKSQMHQVGRDFLLVKDYDPTANLMALSVPPDVEPRRVSVDAIEHWMIYREHPTVGAIIHVHAWMEGAPATQFNYPCGSYQLADAVAQKIRQAPNPAQAVVGLKNHGLTLTGYTLQDILERIEGKLLKTVPMS